MSETEVDRGPTASGQVVSLKAPLPILCGVPLPGSQGTPLSDRMRQVAQTLPKVLLGECFDVPAVPGVAKGRLQMSVAAVIATYSKQNSRRKFVTSVRGLDTVRVWRTA